MNSRRHHCLRHHGRFRQTEASEIPTSLEPPSPNLSDPRGYLPPPHTPELPVFRNRFPSLSHPFPLNALPPNQWHHPLNQQDPFLQNVNLFPPYKTFTPSSSPPKTFIPQTQFGSIKTSAPEERPPLSVFPPDQSRIHWADGSSSHHDYSPNVSGSHKSKSSKHSRSPSASSHSDFSRPTSAGYSDNSEKEEHLDAAVQNFDEDDLGNSLDILAKYKPCTSCKVDTTNKLDSPDIDEEPPAPSGTTLDSLLENFENQPSRPVSAEFSSEVKESPERPVTPPLLMRFEANQKQLMRYEAKQKQRQGLWCNLRNACKKRRNANVSKKWHFVKDFKRDSPDQISKESSKWLVRFRIILHFVYIVLLAAAASVCIHTHETVTKAEDIQKSTANAPTRETLGPTPTSELKNIPTEEPTWFNKRLGILLPDHWVAIRVPDNEHEEEFLRKLFRNDGQRGSKKTFHRHKKTKEKLTNPNNKTRKDHDFQTNRTVHRQTGSKEKNRHHHRDHTDKIILRSEENAELDNVRERDSGKEQYQTEGEYSVSKNDSIEATTEKETAMIKSEKSPTRNPLWQDEHFVQRLNDHVKTPRGRIRNRTTLRRVESSTTPLPTLSSTSTLDYNVVVTTKPEEENIISRDGDKEVPESELAATLASNIPEQNPLFPYKFKKKIHLTQPTIKEKPPQRPLPMKPPNHFFEDLPENVLPKPKPNRKPNAGLKERISVLRFPDTEFFQWNKTNFYNTLDKKWNDEHFYYNSKKPSQARNRLGIAVRDGPGNPETIINPGSNEMKAPPNPLVIQERTEKPAIKVNFKALSENTSGAIFIALNVLFFTLTGSATLFIWDLYGRMVGHTPCVIPFLFFNILWFTSVAIAFIVLGTPYWPIAILLLILVLLHISEVLIWHFCTPRKKKRRVDKEEDAKFG